LERLSLPHEPKARPKRLRFLIFTAPGRLEEHARRTMLRMMRSWNRFTDRLPRPYRASRTRFLNS
jgi:hypothetical protein